MVDPMALIAFTNRLSGQYQEQAIVNLADEYAYLNHPYVYQAAGQACLSYRFYTGAIPLFRSAIKYGLEIPRDTTDALFFDPIGSSIAKILTQYDYDVEQTDVIDKLIKLGYYYLSMAIQLNQVAFESLSSRAELTVLQQFHNSIIPATHLREILTISDYVNAAQHLVDSGYSQESQEKWGYALKIQQDLEGIPISGKDAEEYSIREIAEIGTERHKEYLTRLTKDIKVKKILLQTEELEKFFSTVTPK